MTEIEVRGDIAMGDTGDLWGDVLGAVAGGGRFAGMFGTMEPEGSLRLSAHVAVPGTVDTFDVYLPPGTASYPALTPKVPGATWYEREIHDLFGVLPRGHPRLAPLAREQTEPRRVLGEGMFTIPHGPVRSGVMESIEYLVETPGEEIPHLNLRIFYKHRGIERRFEDVDPLRATVYAERVEGIASLAHALAYCHAIERLAGAAVPRAARMIRVMHAELERLANHFDVAMKLADAAGLAVAVARFGRHKERALRLAERLCGSRFGRGVVRPGGVDLAPAIGPAQARTELDRLVRDVTGDAAALLDTASFLDRLRGTGRLTAARAREHGALGPIGRASIDRTGIDRTGDVRAQRPYDGYVDLGLPAGEPPADPAGDALARLTVRIDECAAAFRLIRAALDALDERSVDEGDLRVPLDVPDGRAVGWAEAPQGEVLYDVTVASGVITRCRPRSASFHNLILMHDVFAGDVLTDFAFIEASFGLSIAGAAL